MEAPAAAPRSDVVRALREAGITALIGFGLLLPLIGFNTVQNIRNELVLETRWVLLFSMVAIIAALRFVQAAFVAPYLAHQRLTRPAVTAVEPTPWWTNYAVLGALVL